jgi:hypothetical protein
LAQGVDKVLKAISRDVDTIESSLYLYSAVLISGDDIAPIIFDVVNSDLFEDSVGHE